MQPEEYAILYDAERTHWWYRGMAHITRALLEAHQIADAKINLLDAGCGTGFAAISTLAEFANVTAFDSSPYALHYARLYRVPRLTCASLDALPFASSHFDWVTAFDSLGVASLRDDEHTLREFWRVLRPGGKLLLRVAALNALRGEHDQRVQNARRYNRRELVTKLIRCGFRVQHSAYANGFLLPLVWLQRKLENLRPAHTRTSNLSLPPHWLNTLLQGILTAETSLVRRGWLPLGVSLFVIAIKPSPNDNTT